MLQGFTTKKGTGISIYGDYNDLKFLHQTLYKSCDTPNDDDKNPISNIILNFAYEVRKAYSRNRLKEVLTFDGVNDIEYLGFNYLWTDLLVTISALRHQAGYITTDEIDQANIYILEYITKMALEQYDEKGALILKNYIGQRIDIEQPLLEQILQYINIAYLEEKPTKTRFRNIDNYLHHFASSTHEHKDFLIILEQRAMQMNCKPMELTFGDENYPEEIIW